MSRSQVFPTRLLIVTGWLGLAGAVLVGIGEFALQFSPSGGYELPGYPFFLGVSSNRIAWGHYLSVLSAPLYLVGYWHFAQVFSGGGSRRSGWLIGALGGYAFVVGNAWLGGRASLALTVQAIHQAADPALLQSQLAAFSQLNESLVNVLRVAIALISVIWIWRVSAGKTLYPPWMAVASPGAILALVFLVYGLLPSVGVWLLPSAMNVTHAAAFGLSLLCLRVRRPDSG